MKAGGLSEERLRKNLTALAMCLPTVCQRLCEGMESNHLHLHETDSGDVTVSLIPGDGVFLHSEGDPVREAEEAVRTGLPTDGRSILCLGVGLGYYLHALLRIANPCQPVIAYERDPWLLRLALSRFDFSRDILAGRVRFLLGTDLSSASASIKRPFFIWPHPILKTLYTEEQGFLQSSPAPETRRAMVVTGGLFVQDLVEALQDIGFSVLSWNPRAVSETETIHQLKTYNPHLLFSINLCRGLPEICENLGLPLLVWEVDPTIERLPPARHSFSHTRIHTYRKSRVAYFRAAGFPHTEYLPLAANPKRRHPVELTAEERERYGAEISFVGSSMVDQAATLFELYQGLAAGLRRNPEGPNSLKDVDAPHRLPFSKTDDHENPLPGANRGTFRYCDRLWELALEYQRRTPDQYLLEGFLERRGLGQAGSALVQDANGRIVDLIQCMAEAAASERRLQILTSLPHEKLRVWGDENWRRILPENLTYCGTASHFRELTLIYNGSKINLDINRIYQRDIVTMRVFDIMACMGFVIVDTSDTLGELFDLNHEVVTYRTVEALRPLVEHFLTHEDERLQIAEAGHRRVIKEHTIRKRVEQMLQNLQ